MRREDLGLEADCRIKIEGEREREGKMWFCMVDVRNEGEERERGESFFFFRVLRGRRRFDGRASFFFFFFFFFVPSVSLLSLSTFSLSLFPSSSLTGWSCSTR